MGTFRRFVGSTGNLPCRERVDRDLATALRLYGRLAYEQIAAATRSPARRQLASIQPA